MDNKRGMSAVVTTLLIILLVIVAIGIVWVVVRNILSKGSDEVSIIGLSIDLEIQKISVSVDGNVLDVTVKRNSGKGNLLGINFVISDGENSEVVRKDTNMSELDSEVFSFSLNELGLSSFEIVSIAPIYETSSGKETTANIIDTTTISRGGSDDEGDDEGDDEEDDEEDDEGDDGGTCTPDCTGLQCGLDPVCGTECGPCTGDDVCNGTQQCVAPEECTDTCASLGYVCSTWTICGVEETCLPGCIAPEQCNSTGQCYAPIALNSGTISNAWPPGVGLYFDSLDLPIDLPGTGYASYYTRFPSRPSLVQCYQILGYLQPELGVYDKAIVEIYVSEVGLPIDQGDTYEIWEDEVDCLNSMSS